MAFHLSFQKPTPERGYTLQGGGQNASLLKWLIKFYGIDAHRIRVYEHQPDILPAMAELDLLVMPSLSEGTPFALVEAMACGRPAVGTPVGGIPELIVEGETGWLARSTEVADVSDALERAWSARSQWPTIGAKAQSNVATMYDQNHSINDIIAALQHDIRIL
jgi:L-malate glycosyltransferase